MMLFLKKALVWLKHHWQIPLLVIGVVVSFIVFQGKSDALIKAFKKNREGYRKQIDEIKTGRGKLDKKIEKNQKDFEAREEEIAKEAAVDSDKLDKKEKERASEIEEDGDLANKLKEEFDL
jgi:hypothetical protein